MPKEKAMTTKEKEASALAAQEEEAAAVLAGAVGGGAGGASGGGASGVLAIITNYFDSRFNDVIKEIQVEIKRLTTISDSSIDQVKLQMATSVSEFNDVVEKISDRISTVEHKKSVTDVDVAAIKKCLHLVI